MTWFRVDDSLAFHAKVVAAGNAAVGLWVRAGSWSSQQLTDGFVPEHMVSSLGNATQARRLVSAGLWTREEGGYRFHEWGQRNPLREKVEKEREAASDRQRRARDAARSRRDEVAVPEGEDQAETGESRRDNYRDSHRSSDAVAVPPTRPDPTPTGSTEPVEAPRRAPRGSRLPSDWRPSEAGLAFARDLRLDTDRVLARFRDHWQAKSGRDGVKLDWDATWRNWCRTDAERRGNVRPLARASGGEPIDLSGVPPHERWQYMP